MHNKDTMHMRPNVKAIGSLLLVGLLVAGCSSHTGDASNAQISEHPAAVDPAVAKAAEADEAAQLTFEKTVPVHDGESCLVVAASTKSGKPILPFAYLHDPDAYTASRDTFVHQDMAKASAPAFDQLIAQLNPTGTRYFSFTTEAGKDSLNPYVMGNDGVGGFSITSGAIGGLSFSKGDVYACQFQIQNSGQIAFVRVRDETKARAISKLLDSRAYTIRFLARADEWNQRDYDSSSVAEITGRAMKVQILDANGQVLAEDIPTE
jgi:hypothetical protein